MTEEPREPLATGNPAHDRAGAAGGALWILFPVTGVILAIAIGLLIFGR